MTSLSEQMQGKMTLILNDLRERTLARMTEAGERIKNRPVLKGDQSFEHIKSHRVMQKEETIGSYLIDIPGLSEIANAAVDVAEHIVGDRKATYDRPQDRKNYTPKQQAKIRDDNRMDLELFQALDDKLNTLNTYIAQGYTLGLDWNGELIPWEQIETPKHIMKITPEEEFELTAHNLNYAVAMNINRPPMTMALRA